MKFLSTVYGSWLKVFISAILTHYLIELGNGQKLFSWDMVMFENLLTAGIVAMFPVIINWLDTNDKRYGNLE